MAGRSAGLVGAVALVLASCTGGGGGGTAAESPLHADVRATVFWVGEPADADNDDIANAQSYWDADWQAHFGGVDDPDHRVAGGRWPTGFRPRENPFYFALPYGELDDDDAIKPDVTKVPWYDGQRIDRDHSILKNRWIEVRRGGTTVYAQWQDVGPFAEDDPDYVFGTAAPREQRSGLDLSPAAADALGLDGRAQVSWRFVRAQDVPAGPWTEIRTSRGGVPEDDQDQPAGTR